MYSSTRLVAIFLSLICLNISFFFSQKVLCASEHSAKPLRIAVSSNFTPILKKLLIEFHQQTKIKTQIISGATGAIFIQIQHGAPFDIFVAADSIRPAKLEQQGLTLANSRQTYAQGQLALLSMNSTSRLSDLTSKPKKMLQRFAIANPNTAPYGKAAKQVLEHLGLWQQYKPKLIMGININQTFAQVRSQAVNLGLVANSQLVLNNLSGVIIPPHYHEPIDQQLVILKSSTNIDKAKRLSKYLLSLKVQKKIVDFGYAESVL
jgi:molybdate transport system substrate-binding protein